jgi:hypothetical protein
MHTYTFNCYFSVPHLLLSNSLYNIMLFEVVGTSYTSYLMRVPITVTEDVE